jgi:SAM-dependent methyltransferase
VPDDRIAAMPSDSAAITSAPTVTDTLREAYNRTLYVGRPCATSHPARIRAIAQAMGVAAPPLEHARILEIGCGDGGNLIPMAAAWPGTTCVGIDLAEQGIVRANAFAADLALRNARFVAADLRDLAPEHAGFDYILAHGFYSWVPAEVRDVLFAEIRARLAPDGIAFVSHNTLPGCRLRELAWSIIRPATAMITDPVERVARTREIARTMADAMSRQPGLPAALAVEFSDVATRPDFAIVHDDLSTVNAPVFLRDIVAHAADHGLAWLGDADPFRHAVPAFGDAANAWIAKLPPLEQEHVIDHIRLRRYRESLFRRDDRPAGTPMAAQRLPGLFLSAANDMLERHAQSQRPPGGERAPQVIRWGLLDRLVAAHPAAIAVDELAEWTVAQSGPGGAFARREDALAMLLRAALTGAALLYAEPPRAVVAAGPRPRAFPPARWQATRRDFVTNLRHEPAALNDAVQRECLVLLDGTRGRDELVARLAALRASGRPVATLDDYLGHFAKLGLLEA